VSSLSSATPTSTDRGTTLSSTIPTV
jgi:hypothetical protein